MAKKLETATVATGWFWTPDASFGALKGIVRTRVGYCGGTKAHPSYYDIGDHTETIQLDYDPEVLTYEQLLEEFWECHHPVYAMDIIQYMSIIFYEDEKQKHIAEESLKKKAAEWGKQIYTKISPITEFTLAEDYHQKYYLRGVTELQGVITFTDEQIVNSPLAAKLNSYVSGKGTFSQLESCLSDAAEFTPVQKTALVETLKKHNKTSVKCV